MSSLAQDVRPLLVYDGDCAFCTRTVQIMERRIRRHPRAEAWQLLDLDALDLTSNECNTSVQWVGADGRTLSAHRAIARVFVDGGKGWWILGRVLQVPGFSWLSGVLYRWVARNRHRLPGGTPACSLPAAQRPGARPLGTDDAVSEPR